LKICNKNKHPNLLFKKEIKIGETQNLELFIFPPCPLVNAHRNKFLQATSPERNAAVGIVHLLLPKKTKKSEMKTSYRKRVPLFIADSIAVPTFSRYSIARGWILEASVFHSLHVRSARCEPFVSKYLCSRGAEIPSILSGVKPSSAALQCPKKHTHQRKTKKKNNNNKKKIKKRSSVHLEFGFLHSNDPIIGGHLNNAVLNPIQCP